jgi:carbonic anhydrase/acetyltransferase-like protein (isoleucine patch superfamily)
VLEAKMIYSLDGKSPQFKGDCWIADNAAVIGAVILGHNASVWFNAVVRGDCDEIHIGENSNIQDGSVLHTDPGVKLLIGRDCTIGHLVMLHGCEIGDNSLVGIKSVLLNRVRLGRNCIVGANSLVTEGKQFPDNTLIMGSPAKVVREVSDQEAQFLKLQAAHYVENARRFREKLQPA